MLGQGKTVQQAEIDAACELIDFWRFNVGFARRDPGQPADLRAGSVEPHRLPPAGRLRLRHHPVQLHRDRREPAHRTGADGQHGALEAEPDPAVRRPLHHAAAARRPGCRPGWSTCCPATGSRFRPGPACVGATTWPPAGVPCSPSPARRPCSAARSPGCAIRTSSRCGSCWSSRCSVPYTPGVTGHASSLASHEVAVTTVALHVAAASLWVGGLGALIVLLGRRRELLAVALPRFSTLAGACLAVVTVSRRAHRAGPARFVGGAVPHRLRGARDRQGGEPTRCCSATGSAESRRWPPVACGAAVGRDRDRADGGHAARPRGRPEPDVPVTPIAGGN